MENTKEISYKNRFQMNQKQKFTCYADQYLASDVYTSTDESITDNYTKNKIKDNNSKNKSKIKVEDDSLAVEIKTDDSTIYVANDSKRTKKTKKRNKIHDLTSFSQNSSNLSQENESLSSDSSFKMKKKIKKEKLDAKIEEDICITSDNNILHSNNSLDDAKSKKKKKKKHDINNTSELSSKNGFTSDGTANSSNNLDSKQIQERLSPENDALEAHPDYALNINSIKKKKKKKERKDDMSGSNIDASFVNNCESKHYTYYKNGEDITKKIIINKSESINIDDTNNSLEDVCKKSKKQKKKDKDRSNRNLDENFEFISPSWHYTNGMNEEDTTKKVKIKDEPVDVNNSLADEYHKPKKKKKKDRDRNIDEELIVDIYATSLDIKIKKEKNREKSEHLEEDEDYKKKKKRKIEDEILASESQEIQEDNKKQEYIEEKNNSAPCAVEKSKKKKHKKYLDESDQSRVIINEEIDMENADCEVEKRKKKKKKKKHSELRENESYEDVDRKNGQSSQDENNEKNDDYNYKKKKKKKHKNNDEVDVSKESNCNSSDSRKKSKSKNELCQDKIQVTEENEGNNSCNNTDSESSDDENVSESERVPRVRKPKSIFERYPKIAKIMEESDDDDYYPHLQCRRVTLEEALELANLKVKLQHEVPPQHQIEKSAGTRILSNEERKQFEEYTSIRSGRFDPEEDQQIVHNWKKFCKYHKWQRKIIYPFLHEKRKGFFFLTTVEERKKFVQFLAKGLPDRSLYSVYHRFKNLYAIHKTSRYTKEEDEIILNEMSNSKERTKFAILAKKLNRTRPSVWRHYKLLMKKKKKFEEN